ncbi:pre-coat protein [Ageratum yellow vein Sri Lanka virus]|uniref:Protein V2 n=1 Tax=Ageratum yellow vein Sri Lanka virus TaxID=222079 RepID=Q91BQ5_9GEMI|nr:pre-coat protein [Ageratum yellow vein Sri Lanka virus]AAK70850.1 pre-coat protein [Ageratum yellow vein Sri Lanka virus]
MWDPLLNEFPDTVHGFRCMLAVKYLQLVENTYSPDSLGYDLIRDLISVIRAKNYVEATSRYNHFHSRIEGASPSQLRDPVHEPCSCPHCPRHKVTSMGQQAHESETQNIQNVQKS